jgi:hypothetical protein
MISRHPYLTGVLLGAVAKAGAIGLARHPAEAIAFFALALLGLGAAYVAWRLFAAHFKGSKAAKPQPVESTMLVHQEKDRYQAELEQLRIELPGRIAARKELAARVASRHS